mmetsp:Transcript_47852/g.154210  ORF Transcript_47852/g.154210 Transcript_47852/m.154210 type:complete len:215 (+) Transcript_47852:2359-3003(+)
MATPSDRYVGRHPDACASSQHLGTDLLPRFDFVFGLASLGGRHILPHGFAFLGRHGSSEVLGFRHLLASLRGYSGHRAVGSLERLAESALGRLRLARCRAGALTICHLNATHSGCLVQAGAQVVPGSLQLRLGQLGGVQRRSSPDEVQVVPSRALGCPLDDASPHLLEPAHFGQRPRRADVVARDAHVGQDVEGGRTVVCEHPHVHSLLPDAQR